MKRVKILAVILLLITMLAGTIGCSNEEETEGPETTTATVQRGDITSDITAAGNLALSQTEALVADLFYQQGTVSEVLVEAGDSVSEGDVLVKLDADEWQEQLDALEESVTAAKRLIEARARSLAAAEHQLGVAERKITDYEAAVAEAQRQVTSKELAVMTAEVNLETAYDSLDTIVDVKELRDKIDECEQEIAVAQAILTGNTSGTVNITSRQYWLDIISGNNNAIAAYEAQIRSLLGGTTTLSTSEANAQLTQVRVQIGNAELNLAAAQAAAAAASLAVQEAQNTLDYALYQIEGTRTDVDYAHEDVTEAEDSYAQAQQTLDEAREKSPDILAPFDGFITAVNVKGGDDITKGTVAVQIADPDKFEVSISVGESDILSVDIGTAATVDVDAVSGISFPAEITYISPTANVQSGVVNYTVTVELDDIDEVVAQMRENMQAMRDSMASGNTTGGFTPPEGFVPPSSMELPEGIELPDGFKMPQGFGQGSAGQGLAAAISEDYDLRDGMSVTVSLIIASETDVLLVPYTAITTIGMQSYVDVVLESGETEQREVTTGTTNYSFIVITDGLEEGETVVVPIGTVNSSGSFPSGGFFMGGPGGGGVIVRDR